MDEIIKDKGYIQSRYDQKYYLKRDIKEDKYDINKVPIHFINRKKFVGDIRNSKILEVGCGEGDFMLYFAKSNELFGIDISRNAIELAKQRAKKFGVKNYEFSVGDVEDIQYPDDSFDVVMSFELLEHLHDYGKGIREVVRVCKPNGRIFLSCPNYYNFAGIKKKIVEFFIEGDWGATKGYQPIENFMTYKCVVKGLEENGAIVYHREGSCPLTPFFWLMPVFIWRIVKRPLKRLYFFNITHHLGRLSIVKNVGCTVMIKARKRYKS